MRAGQGRLAGPAAPGPGAAGLEARGLEAVGFPAGGSGADGDVLRDPRRVRAVRRLLAAGVRFEALDGLVDLAAQVLGTSSAQVSLLTEQQFVPAAVGLGLPVPRTSDAADSLCTLTLRAGAPVAIGQTRQDPQVAGLPPVRSGAVGSYLGVPLVVDGLVVGALCVFDTGSRQWTDEQVSVLSALGRAVTAELELRALTADLALSTTRLDVALSAASIGSFELDPDTGRLMWDDRLVELFGYSPDTFDADIASFFARLHPDEHDRVTAAIEECVATRGELALEYRIMLPGGETRWVTARGRVVPGDAGPGEHGVRLVGAAFDSTDVRHGRDRLARLLESMTDAFFSLDRNWRFTYVNSRGETVLGRPRSELLGRNVWEEFPAAVDADFHDRYHHAVETGETVTFEAFYPAPLDKWFEVRAWPTPDGLSVFFHDVSARRLVELERERAYADAEAATQRLAILAEITGALSSTLEVDESMDRLVRLVVPRLADWAAVTLVDEVGALREGVARHADVARADDIARFPALQIRGATEQSLSRTVLRTGRAVLRSAVTPAALRAGWEDDELTGLLERLGLATLMVVPLQVRDRVLGVLLLAGGPDRPAFTEADLAVATEVGRRAALSLDNAKLFGRQRSAAETLQRHLLPALPQPDHLEMRARYRPAAQEAQVGGDFYWGAIQEPDGATVVAIGDVSGHDLEAISWQAQLAPLLRGFAFEGQDGPAAVLTRVDRAMRGLQIDTMATAVLARIEQSDGDVHGTAGGGRALRWSNAGHPPPMLLRADGRVEALEVEPDLLLGLDPDAARGDHTVTLEPRDTLLLYTDGLIERRDSPLDHGLVRLRQTLKALVGLPLDELCDQVLLRMLPGEPDDDIALLAVRAHPEDRPRPPEAGPGGVPPALG